MTPVFALLLPFIAALLLWRYTRARSRAHGPQHNRKPHVGEDVDGYTKIEPLPDFDWKTTPPLRNSPLKPRYNLTMSIETSTLSDLIAMDNTYADQIQLRRQLMTQHPDATLQCNPAAVPAVLELHHWIFNTYLPSRFPTIYKPTTTPSGLPSLTNTVTNEAIPLHPSSPTTALRDLGAHVDTDFTLLLPRDPDPDHDHDRTTPTYHLEAFICCFLAGFSFRRKLGLPLAAIHTPVPGYAAKLAPSMDRFFARLPCGKLVKRSNWSVTTDAEWFKEDGVHLYGRSEVVDDDNEIAAQRAAVRVDACRLRSERQTLFRLPRSRAVVFAFKTYQYRLEDVKRDGYAAELAAAIEGLSEGNVPDMMFYKRGVVWAEPVLEYLRS